MKNSIDHCDIILKLNSKLFLNALAGVSEEQAKERISDHNNSLLWIATHTTWARYNMVGMLGKPVTNPYVGPNDTSMKLPSLESVKEEWEKATLLLNDALASVKEEHLKADAPFKSPIGDFSMGGTIAFLAQHESYDIGQMGFLKKFLTKEAMSYK
jgi:hypothetical protein